MRWGCGCAGNRGVYLLSNGWSVFRVLGRIGIDQGEGIKCMIRGMVGGVHLRIPIAEDSAQTRHCTAGPGSGTRLS